MDREYTQPKMVTLKNTRFIFKTNFSGDPELNYNGAQGRKANIVIPDVNQARDMIDSGFNVKWTKPRDGEEEGFVPTYYIEAKIAYRDRYGKELKYPPKIILVGEHSDMALTEETVGRIDRVRIGKVDAFLSAREWEPGRYSVYVKTLYATQDIEDDPFAADYRREPDEF